MAVAFDTLIDANNLNAWLARIECDYKNVRDVFGTVQALGKPPVGTRSIRLW